MCYLKELYRYNKNLLIYKSTKFFSKVNVLTGTELKNIFQLEVDDFNLKTNSLIIILGTLGDFDSFEYVQATVPILNRLIEAKINLIIVGLGNEESKKEFCNYTKLPEEYIRVVENLNLHNKLNLNNGLNLPIHPLLNLMLMCLGFNSPGTLKEVLRGYIGDDKSKKLFNDTDIIYFCKNISFKAKLFSLLGGKSRLRPLELASLRLMNMIEVISKWNIYMIKPSFLTQRGATYLTNKEGDIIYTYKNNGLLDFSESKSDPLKFINILQ